MELKIDGDMVDLDRRMVAARLRGRVPEQVLTHWVDVDGTRFPVKQALEAGSGIARRRFTSQTARSLLVRLGFTTSPSQPRRPAPLARHFGHDRRQPSAPNRPVPRSPPWPLSCAAVPLTDGVSALEHQLVNADRHTVAAVTTTAGITEDLPWAALIVRRDVGRVSDVIHAAVISLALPVILWVRAISVDCLADHSVRPSCCSGQSPTLLWICRQPVVRWPWCSVCPRGYVLMTGRAVNEPVGALAIHPRPRLPPESPRYRRRSACAQTRLNRSVAWLGLWARRR
jgi:hypothetical protein